MLKDVQKAVEKMMALTKEELELANAEVAAKRRGRAGGRKSAAKRAARKVSTGKAVKSASSRPAKRPGRQAASASNGSGKTSKTKPSLTERLTGRSSEMGGRPTAAAAQDSD